MRRSIPITGIIMLLLGMMPVVASAQDNCEEFPETGYETCGRFQTYWDGNGGLPVFGYPISNEFAETRFDTGATSTAQYFERERLEYHPANEGTGYEVLLGRLGVEVLQSQGRNWHDFPKASPGEANYMPATGQAIAPEFWEYWRGHGLDLGDAGISFRESLALFGYPISQAEMETNADGDTVLTQWFERARFELHGDRVLLGLLGVETLAVPGTDDPVVAATLAQVRQSTGLFHDLDTAMASGWNLVEGLDHCFNNPGVGAMGMHYINAEMLDLELDPLAPEAMVYQHGPDGSLSFGAVEWIVPAEPWDAEHDELPEVLGRSLHLNEALGVYVMHAWHFLENPAGVFEDWNPDVSCPAEEGDELDDLREAITPFQDVEAAQAAGWNLQDGLDHCFDNPGVGGMGVHYINADMLDLALDPLAPEAMVYQYGADGELVLGAVEWIVPAEPWDAEHDELPEVMGRHLHLNEALGVYVMHAWLFVDNPAGTYEDWNPDISECQLPDAHH
ncbi:MAG TPA: hypothetical protein VHG52_00425 [Thermomicrobiales bacterium]|nr:hypothetical protein [Thermomicrobiales bacterium]